MGDDGVFAGVTKNAGAWMQKSRHETAFLLLLTAHPLQTALS